MGSDNILSIMIQFTYKLQIVLFLEY